MCGHRWANVLFSAVLIALFGAVSAFAAEPVISLDQAEQYQDFVLQCLKQGKFKEGIPYGQQSLQSYLKNYGEIHEATATAHNNLAALYDNIGDFEHAKPLRIKALEIRKDPRVSGPNSPDTATLQNNLGYLLLEMGDYKEGRVHLQEALRIYTQNGMQNQEPNAFVLNNIGLLEHEVGNYALSKQYYTQAQKIALTVWGLNHRYTLLTFNNLGTLAMDMGDDATAKEYLEKALSISRAVNGDKNPRTALPLNNLGNVMLNMGDYAKAQEYYKQALEIRKETMGLDKPLTGASYNVLGSAYRQTANEFNRNGKHAEAKDEFAKARENVEQGLAIRKKAFPDDHHETADSHNMLGLILQESASGDDAHKNYDEALKNYEEALRIRRKTLGNEHPDTGLSLNNIGSLYLRLGKLDQALDYFNQALKVYKKDYSESHPQTRRTLSNCVLVEAARSNWKEAAEVEDRARRGTREYMTHVLPALSQKQQLRFMSQLDDGRFFSKLSLGLHSDEYPPLAAMSAVWLANGKAAIQESLAQRTSMALTTTDQPTKDLIAALNAVRVQYATRSQTSPKPEEAEKFRRQLAELEKQEQELSAAVNSKLNLSAQKAGWTEIDDIRKAIPKGALLIDIAQLRPFNFKETRKEFSLQPARYYAWLTPSAGEGEITIVDLGEVGPIDAAIEKYQADFKLCQSPDQEKNPLKVRGEKEAELELQKTLAELSKKVLDPLRPHLAGKQELIVSPDAGLWLVPWAALPVEEGVYAIEKWNIHFVVASRDLAVKFVEASKNPPRIFANPNYNLPVAEMSTTLLAAFGGRSISTGTLDANLLAMNDLRGRSAGRFGAVSLLPGTAQEAAAITPNLKTFAGDAGEKLKQYSENQAMEGVFKRLAAPRVLVVSTHGFFLPDQETKSASSGGQELAGDAAAGPRNVDLNGDAIENPLVRCGLLLAGCNNRDKIPANSDLDDGVLTGMEIVGTNLRGTELVVLSACETGIGKVNNGEGVSGLRQAFQLAGAQSVVSTLWQIPDVATAQLMNDFFANLAAGQSKSEALRNAQLTRIKVRREKYGAAHPLFWAAFTLTGGN